MKNNKFLSILFALMIALSFVPLNINATTEYRVDFFDNANLIDDADEEKIIQMAEAYKNSLEMDIVYVTTNNTNFKESMEYADDFYDGIESAHTYNENGILFLIDLYNSEVYISTAGRAIDLMSDEEIETALDEFFYARGDNDYASAMYAMSENAFENMSYWDQKGADTIWYKLKLSTDQIVGGFGLTGALLIFLCIKHNKSNEVLSAVNYIDENGYKINKKNVRFIKEYPIVRRNYYREKSNSSGGRHSSGSSHRSSSGRSHGGGGRRL